MVMATPAIPEIHGEALDAALARIRAAGLGDDAEYISRMIDVAMYGWQKTIDSLGRIEDDRDRRRAMMLDLDIDSDFAMSAASLLADGDISVDEYTKRVTEHLKRGAE
jgi:hypothetical protein